MSMQTLTKNKYFKWINISVIGTLFLFIMTIDIIKVMNSEFKSESIEVLLDPYLWALISTYTVFIPGFKYLKTYKLLLKRKIHMDILIALAIHVSYLFSIITIFINKDLNVIWEPIGLLYLFDAVGNEIEMYIGTKNDSERYKLQTLKEEFATTPEGEKVAINDVKVGDLIVFKKNDVIQFDGILHSDQSIVDKSNINGESKSQFLKKNSNVVSGSKVISETMTIKVKYNFKNSTLNKLILLINKTNKLKPKIQMIADTIAKYLLPLVLILTILVWSGWMILGYTLDIKPFISTKDQYLYNSFLITISVLAMACPCAMTMTAPLINLVSAQSYWKANVVFNKTQDMEKILFINHVILDKTGTLTINEMIISKEYGDKKYHAISAGLEKEVYHPIANALYKKYNQDIEIKSIKNINGHGVEGKYNNKKYHIGKVTNKEINKTFKTKASKGTYVGLYEDKKLVSSYVLESKIKKDAKKLIAFFKEKNITPIIISGDNEIVTKEVANKLNIDYRSNQSPQQKAKYIQSLQKQGKKVMMIGDGLNDSIAIKYSDVSISFSSGSSISNSYSSVTLLSDELKNIIFLIKMGKVSRRNYKIAISWAIGFNLVFLPIAAVGLIFPWASALIMYLSNTILFLIILLFKYKLKLLEKRVYGKRNKKSVEGKITKKNTKVHKISCH